MYAFFDYYTFSGAKDFIQYAKYYAEYVTNGNLCITASFETVSIMDEVINILCKHFEDKNILILSEDEFKANNPQCLTRLLTPNNTMETIQGVGQYFPMHLLIIIRNVNSVFTNLAITSFAKQYHIPIINVMVEPLNHSKVVCY